MAGELRVAEVLGALSLATDLGSGMPFEKGLRTAVAAATLADGIDLALDDRRAAYYAALLRSLGCTANSPEFAALFDDDVAVQRELKTIDLGDADAFAAQLEHFGSWAGPGRAAELSDRFVNVLPERGQTLGRAGCEVSAALGSQLGLPGAAVAALDEVYERWDGKGFPEGRRGERLTIAARVVHVAEQAVTAHFTGGRAGAEAEVRRRSSGHLDPALCTAFAEHADAVFAALESEDLLASALSAEPPPAARVGAAGLDRMCLAFAAFADLTLSAVTVSGTAGAGISINGANTFAITSSVTVADAGADGVDINGGAGAASVAAAISGSAGHSLDVQSRGGGTLVVSGAITDAGNGVLLAGNSGATIKFTGPITSATTNSHPAFQALGGGTISASSAGNTLSAAGAAALDVESTAIGSAGLQFQSISAGTSPSSGPADGVILSATGPGALTVTGALGHDGSGGTIQGTTAAALSLSNSGGVSLTDMALEPASGDGVSASAVPSLGVFLWTITGGQRGITAGGDASTLQTPQTFDIESNILSGQQGAAISLTYAGSTTGSVVQNTIGSESPVLAGSTGGDGIDISPSGAAEMTAQVGENHIDQIQQGDGIDAQASSSALLNLTLADNTVQMDSSTSHDGVVVGSAGSVCLNPIGNTVVAAGSSASDNAIEVDQLGTSSVFEIQGYSGSSDASGIGAVETLLSSRNPDLRVTGAGSTAVATPDGSNGFSGVPGLGVSCPVSASTTGTI